MQTKRSSLLTEEPVWMSWWDRYFAPGDVRQRRQLQQQLQDEVQQREATLLKSDPRPARLDPALRARRQGALLYGGLAFTLASIFVTRRASRRKLVQTVPNTFTPSNAEPTSVDGSIEAVQALGYATLNVFSFAMASVGLAMTYFDVADVEDMRMLLRQSVGEDVYGGESAADKEIEGWIAETLARKDGQGNLREGIAEKIYELEKQAKQKAADERRR